MDDPKDRTIKMIKCPNCLCIYMIPLIDEDGQIIFSCPICKFQTNPDS